MKRRSCLTAYVVLVLLALAGFADGSEDVRIGASGRSGIDVGDQLPLAPSYGRAPRGQIYDGPYPPPYLYYPHPYPYPYPYPPYQGPPSSYYSPPEEDLYGGEVIPAGRLVLLVDPVSADVYVDGHPLKQREDLSYEVALLVGKHKVEVRAEGYSSYEKWIEISGGHRIVLTIRLESDQ